MSDAATIYEQAEALEARLSALRRECEGLEETIAQWRASAGRRRRLPGEPPTVIEIIEAVEGLAELPYGSLRSPRRARRYAYPRFIAMTLANSLRRDLSLPEIARIFRRDHTTLMHGINRGNKLVRESAGWQRLHDSAREMLEAE